MHTTATNRIMTSLLAGVLLFLGPRALAQTGSSGGASPAPSSEGSATTGKDKSPVNYDNAVNMAPARETKAFKVFEAVPDSQFDKKSKVGEDFIQKFPTSLYLPQVYATLTVLYIQNGQEQKGFADGEKVLALKPNDVRTMANLAQAMTRMNNPTDADLQKAQQYAQKCIQLIPTLPKPEGAPDQEFAAANNITLTMAHSALGLINIRHANFAEAIPELKEAVRLGEAKDPTNLYLLGIANQNSSHYAEAADAFTKCAAFPGNLQKACQDGAAAAQKDLAANPPKH